jgi:protein-S-isoprenylcysteine O-methyltransferase Ste14
MARLAVGFPMEPSESPPQKLVTPASLAVDLVLLVVFFAYMYSVLSTHVPSNDPGMIRLWGAISASCLTGVFWLALQMFRVTFAAQRRAGKK